jgi:hypothetical protein
MQTSFWADCRRRVRRLQIARRALLRANFSVVRPLDSAHDPAAGNPITHGITQAGVAVSPQCRTIKGTFMLTRASIIIAVALSLLSTSAFAQTSQQKAAVQAKPAAPATRPVAPQNMSVNFKQNVTFCAFFAKDVYDTCLLDGDPGCTDVFVIAYYACLAGNTGDGGDDGGGDDHVTRSK